MWVMAPAAMRARRMYAAAAEGARGGAAGAERGWVGQESGRFSRGCEGRRSRRLRVRQARMEAGSARRVADPAEG